MPMLIHCVHGCVQAVQLVICSCCASFCLTERNICGGMSCMHHQQERSTFTHSSYEPTQSSLHKTNQAYSTWLSVGKDNPGRKAEALDLASTPSDARYAMKLPLHKPTLSSPGQPPRRTSAKDLQGLQPLCRGRAKASSPVGRVARRSP
jgi:hypothetical protein